MQSVENPDKLAYAKFDVLVKAMKVEDESSGKEKDVGVKGLLKRLKSKSESASEDKNNKQEPLEIALDYFFALRQQREKLKQEI